MELTKCPFGCDAPWPHEPGGCIRYVDAGTWEDMMEMDRDPRGPTPAMLAAGKRYLERLKAINATAQARNE
jgi:hypothetical protein